MSDNFGGLGYLRGLNDTFYDQIKVADQKATLIITLIVLMIVWSPDVRHAFLRPADTSLATLASWLLSVVVAGGLSGALVAALFVVTPRKMRGGGPLFWGGWPAARNKALDVALSGDAKAIAESYADNAAHLAAICRKKYRYVSVAIWSLMIAIGAHFVFVLTR